MKSLKAAATGGKVFGSFRNERQRRDKSNLRVDFCVRCLKQEAEASMAAGAAIASTIRAAAARATPILVVIIESSVFKIARRTKPCDHRYSSELLLIALMITPHVALRPQGAATDAQT